MILKYVSNLFGKGKSGSASEHDGRLLRLETDGFICKSCKQLHRGIFDLGCDNPDQWPEPVIFCPNSDVNSSKHLLTEDFCILNGEHYFVRCVLQLPIDGMPEKIFGYGVWSTLSKINFYKYLENFDTGKQEGLGPWFGWLSNRLKGFPDTLNMKCHIHPQSDRRRPLISLEPSDHPLAASQIEGITIDRLFELYKINGHDLG